MGLDATVYRSKASLKLDVEALGAKKDEATGQYYFDRPDPEKAYSTDLFVAVTKRLGNATAIAELSDEVEATLGTTDTLIESLVLYSGTHSGDTIPYELLDQLEAEISMVSARTKGSRSALLDEFVQAMDELISVARREKNPIVF